METRPLKHNDLVNEAAQICALLYCCVWVLINADTTGNTPCLPEICTSAFLTRSALLDQKNVALYANKGHMAKSKNSKQYCHDRKYGDKFDGKCCIVKGKNRKTENHTQLLTSVQKFLGFEVKELFLIVGFYFSCPWFSCLNEDWIELFPVDMGGTPMNMWGHDWKSLQEFYKTLKWLQCVN